MLCHEGTRAASTPPPNGPPSYGHPSPHHLTSHNGGSVFGILHGPRICSFLLHSEGIWANGCYVYNLNKAGAESLFSILEWGISIIFFLGSFGSLLNSFKPKEVNPVSKLSNQGSLSVTLKHLASLHLYSVIPPMFGEGEGRQVSCMIPHCPGASSCQDNRVRRKEKWPHDDPQKQVTEKETSNHPTTAQ